VIGINKIFLAAAAMWGFIIAFVTADKSIQQDCGSLYSIAVFGIVFGSVAAVADLVLEVWQDSTYICRLKGCDDCVCQSCRCCDSCKACRRTCKVPEKYKGISWIFTTNDKASSGGDKSAKGGAGGGDKVKSPAVPKAGAGTKAKNPEAANDKGPYLGEGLVYGVWWIFFLETFIRFVGNVALYWLLVLASLSGFTNPPTTLTSKTDSVHNVQTNVTTVTTTTETAISGVNCGTVDPAFQWMFSNNNTLFWVTIAFVVVRIFVSFSYPNRSAEEDGDKDEGICCMVGSGEEKKEEKKEEKEEKEEKRKGEIIDGSEDEDAVEMDHIKEDS